MKDLIREEYESAPEWMRCTRSDAVWMAATALLAFVGLMGLAVL